MITGAHTPGESMSQPYGDPNQPAQPEPQPQADQPQPSEPQSQVEQAQPQVEQPETLTAQPEGRKRRRGALIAAIVVGVAALCGGGATAAYLLLADADQQGAASPSAAVDEFLDAVYRTQDTAKATGLVCAQARDEAELTKKIDEVRAYREAHKDPQFTWPEPEVSEEAGETATVGVTVTVTTRDEKVATESLRFTLVRKTGWLVCEVGPAG